MSPPAHMPDLCALPHPQPMDKLERADVVQQASKFVDPGFKLVAKEKVRL